ncbi:MAG: beta-ketoacyl-[acyl-carrier-protein] synthase II [Gammaproteobacteria bacterium]|nr:MAG: beta-ketoacyl-[acyl-carrier-protein] synthase II [Gammaproteobacteria bacterium]
MAKRRVVITGLGLITPLGLDVKTSWAHVLEGKSGIGPITRFDTSRFASRIAGEVRGFDVSRHLSPKEARKLDPFIHYAIAAASEAMEDAGLEVTRENAERIGVAIGSGIGGLSHIERGHDVYLKGGPRKMSPFFIPGSIINMAAGNISIQYGLKGPNIALVSACTTGTHNIGDAARLISHGDADAMLAGGAEAAITPLGLGGFAAARALSTRNDEPEKASRPWDRDRDGFVLSEGAGVVLLEAYESAKARGAPIYAEVIGYGMSADAYHITQPPEDGEGAVRCMENALRDAGIAPEAVDYINAHGTSTPLGDVAEVRAIKAAFKEHAYRLAVSSTKSMTGHMLGAAGAVEAVFSVLALRDQCAPPTINLDHPDEECDLDFVPHRARPMKMDVVMSNSFGFGGTNGTLIFKRLA